MSEVAEPFSIPFDSIPLTSQMICTYFLSRCKLANEIFKMATSQYTGYDTT